MKTKRFHKNFFKQVSEIPQKAVDMFKFGSTLTIISIAYIIVSLDFGDSYLDGAYYYYLPVLEHILLSFVIYFGGMLLYDIAARSYKKKP